MRTHGGDGVIRLYEPIGSHSARGERELGVEGTALSLDGAAYGSKKGTAKTASKTEAQLQPLAAMVLMTIMYAARVARPDLLQPIQFLAKRITRWDASCDARIHKLVEYVLGSVNDQQIGFVGDALSDVTAHLFVDANFAGCPYTLKSTSGVHFDLEGPWTRFPWSSSSVGQTSIAQSTPEAELDAAHFGMKMKGQPALDILEEFLGPTRKEDGSLRVTVHEDNTATLTVAMTGKNQL